MVGRRRKSIALPALTAFLFLLTVATFCFDYFNLPDGSEKRNSNENRQALVDWKVKIGNELRRHRIEHVCPYIYDVPKKLDWTSFMRDRSASLLKPRPGNWWANFHVNEDNKIVYCSIPRVASKYFLQENGTIGGQWKQLADYQQADAMKAMANYRKIVWVRNPLDRLISAWRSKMATQRHAYYSAIVGSQIIRLNRPNATAKETSAGFPVRLHEFLNFLSVQHHPQFFDLHWRPYLDSCSICAINYDYIGKLEEINQELNVFMRNATGSQRRITAIQRAKYEHHPKERAVLKKSIEKGLLRRDLFDKVLLMYKLDYDLFGYDLVEDLLL